MNKTILVAGGAGFIGSHLCESLFKEENKIVCVDNLSTGNKKNILPFLNNKNFQFFENDICEEKTIKILRKISFNEIYHLASPASVTYVTEHPVEAAETNALGTKNLLTLALSQKAKLLFTSSSEAYGDPKEHPQKESYWGNVNPVGVRSGYDEGKRFGEALCMAYYRQLGLDVKIVRIFNTYGPNSRVDESRVVPQFIRQALKRESLTVYGDGWQTRSFCYVSDMVKGLIKMIESNEIGPINLGSKEEFKILDLAKKVIQMTNSHSDIVFTQRPKDDPSIRRPDISLARELLSWEPKVSLEDGLQKTITYFKEILQ